MLTADKATVQRDAREAAVREYMVQRLQFPAALVWDEFDGPQPPREHEAPVCKATMARLHSWSTAALQALLLDLVSELQEGEPLGQRLLQGIAPEDEYEHSLKLDDIARRTHTRSWSLTARQERIRPATWREDGGKGVLTDAHVFDAARREHEQQAGIIHRLCISRAGNFSCPVACGAILVANFEFEETGKVWVPLSRKECSFRSGVEALQDIVGEPVCRHLDDVASLDMLVERVKQGCLPSIIAQSETSAGVFVEFDPAWDPPPCPITNECDHSWMRTRERAKSRGRQPTLRPVGWFKFWTREEAANHQQRQLDFASAQAAAKGAEAAVTASSQVLTAQAAAEEAPPGGTLQHGGQDSDTDDAGFDYTIDLHAGRGGDYSGLDSTGSNVTHAEVLWMDLTADLHSAQREAEEQAEADEAAQDQDQLEVPDGADQNEDELDDEQDRD
ncbi:hypothetical protein WJX72_008794 [[Myrmecia] bisecta]|uniref:Uncharacterized protein n=1 Tax=[Myrmecia] bisecta TaxID=41462 RepID=A0AAW1R8H3_9CHLO